MNFIEEKLCRFRVRIFAEDPFSELWIEMKKFRDAGLSSLELLAFLSNSRSLCDDLPTDGRILALMDIVAGKCASHLAIWPQEAVS